MDFGDIDAARASADIQQKALCERAKVNPSTYSQLKKGRRPRGGYVGTLEKLKAALDELTQEKERADG